MTTAQKLISVLFAATLVAGCSSKKDDNGGAGDGNTGLNTAGAGDVAALRAEVDRVGNVVYFDFDKYDIKAESETVLNAHGKLLKATGEKRTLEGHADERGTREYNMALGEKRGKAVADFLTMQGVAADQLEVVSFGEEKPAVAEHNEAAYSKNRRVEITTK